MLNVLTPDLSRFHKAVLVNGQQELGPTGGTPVSVTLLLCKHCLLPPPSFSWSFHNCCFQPCCPTGRSPEVWHLYSLFNLFPRLHFSVSASLCPACPMGRAVKSSAVFPGCQLRQSSLVLGIWVPAFSWGHCWLPSAEGGQGFLRIQLCTRHDRPCPASASHRQSRSELDST